MGPLDQLLMAARGHQGLPMEINAPDGGDPGTMGGMPMEGMPMMGDQAGLPPVPSSNGASDAAMTADPGQPPASTGGGGTDREIAGTAAQQLLEAARAAQDYELQAALASAAAVLHKYIAKEEKEHHAALGGKLSPRLLARAHGAQ